METSINQPINAVDKTIKGPKALFWYLTLFFTLGLTAFNTGNIWFQYINKWFPLEVSYGYVTKSFNQSALKFSIASILVAAPIFFWFSVMVRKSLKNGLLSPHNKVRVWTTYIILFLTIATTIGDLITTVFKVLDGDFTTRFLLKSFTILFIVGWIFFYYWSEIKSEKSLTDSQLPKTMASITAAILVISFIGAFFIVDSPAATRVKAYDQTRADNLMQLSNIIQNYYFDNNKLPTADDLKSYAIFSDPKTKQNFEYSVKGDKSYELCAVFETSSTQEGSITDQYYNKFVFHDSGRVCFTENINEQLDAQLRAKELSAPANIQPETSVK